MSKNILQKRQSTDKIQFLDRKNQRKLKIEPAIAAWLLETSSKIFFQNIIIFLKLNFLSKLKKNWQSCSLHCQ